MVGGAERVAASTSAPGGVSCQAPPARYFVGPPPTDCRVESGRPADRDQAQPGVTGKALHRRALLVPVIQDHRWRSAFRLHIEDGQFRGLRLTGVATHDVYVSRGFVEDAAGVDGLLATTLHLRNDTSFKYIDEKIAIVPMHLGGFTRSEINDFDHAFLPWQIGKV